MKAAELRINSTYHSVKFNQSVILTAEDIYELVVKAEGASIESYIDEMFNPIRITKERLIKLGFKPDIDLKMILFKLGISCNTDNMEFCYSGQKIRKLEYIHEVQNVCYDLTSDELVTNEKL